MSIQTEVRVGCKVPLERKGGSAAARASVCYSVIRQLAEERVLQARTVVKEIYLPACCRYVLVKLTISAAMSTSRMRLSEAVRFDADNAEFEMVLRRFGRHRASRVG